MFGRRRCGSVVAADTRRALRARGDATRDARPRQARGCGPPHSQARRHCEPRSARKRQINIEKRFARDIWALTTARRECVCTRCTRLPPAHFFADTRARHSPDAYRNRATRVSSRRGGHDTHNTPLGFAILTTQNSTRFFTFSRSPRRDTSHHASRAPSAVRGAGERRLREH